MTKLVVLTYLLAAAGANLAVARLGPWAMPAIGFFMIGFDLTARDFLHERWEGRGLRWRMAALIATGSALTLLLNFDALRVAIASMISFGITATVDTLAYHRMSACSRESRMIGSNIASALVDSVVFPLAAFGIVSPAISAAQWAAKSLGGAAWVGALGLWTRSRA